MNTIELKFESEEQANKFRDWFLDSGEQHYFSEVPNGASAVFSWEMSSTLFFVTSEVEVEPLVNPEKEIDEPDIMDDLLSGEEGEENTEEDTEEEKEEEIN